MSARATPSALPDGEAQYREAARLSQAGEKAAAADLLAQAARAGHAAAGYTLATMRLQGIGGPTDHAAALDLMRAAAEKGLGPAAHACLLFEARGVGLDAPDWPAAKTRLLRLIGMRDPVALRQAGMLTLMAASDAPEGPALLHDAAYAGDALAAFALARLVAEGRQNLPITAGMARHIADRAAAGQHPSASQIQQALSGVQPQALSAPGNSPRSEHLAQLLDGIPVPDMPPAEAISKLPAVWHVPTVLSRIECDYVIGRAARLIQPATILDPKTGQTRPDPYRKSYHAAFYPLDDDLVLHALDRRIAGLSGLDWSNGEMLAVLTYTPGQEYKPHYDTLPQDGGVGESERARGGQRVMTILVTLNDGFSGGATTFTKTGLALKPGPGEAIVFRNVSEEDEPDPLTLHAGCPVTAGTKWLASKWMRRGRYHW